MVSFRIAVARVTHSNVDLALNIKFVAKTSSVALSAESSVFFSVWTNYSRQKG